MTHPTNELSRDDLLKFAADRGYSITPGRLHLWRDQGLMPAPRRVRPAGQRGGSESRYPASAGPQLVAIAESLAETRSLDTARWLLWWRGFDIPHDYIAAQLSAEIDSLKTLRDHVRSTRNPDDDQQTDSAAAKFDKQTRARTDVREVSRLRKRAGRTQFTTLMALLVQALAGEYVDHDPEELDRVAPQIGLEPADQKAYLRGVSALMDCVLREAPDFVGISPRDLTTFRDELRDVVGLLAWLRNSPQLVERLIQRPLPTAVGDLAIGFREEQPGPFDLVLYIALRRNPGAFLPKLAEPDVIASLKQVYEFLQALGARARSDQERTT